MHTFKHLELKTVCAEPPRQPNLMYPITGSIGLAEVVKTYVKLRNDMRLEKAPGVIDITGGTTGFSDVLTYTTTIKAGITPTVELKSAVGEFRLKNASITGSADRVDLHKITIAIATTAQAAQIPKGFIGTRRMAAPGAAGNAAPVILELNTLRDRDDDVKTNLETLRQLIQ